MSDEEMDALDEIRQAVRKVVEFWTQPEKHAGGFVAAMDRLVEVNRTTDEAFAKYDAEGKG